MKKNVVVQLTHFGNNLTSPADRHPDPLQTKKCSGDGKLRAAADRRMRPARPVDSVQVRARRGSGRSSPDKRGSQRGGQGDVTGNHESYPNL